MTVVFLNTDGEREVVKARMGQNLLDVAIDNDINIEGTSTLLPLLAFFGRWSSQSLPAISDTLLRHRCMRRHISVLNMPCNY